MDGRDFIALAGRLAAMPAADEAMYRTAVSRAYYGAFHVARSFLIELGFAPPANANVHSFVRHYLNGSGDRDACRAASLLSQLQSARNRADYKFDEPSAGSRGRAMVCTEWAHRVVSAVENCRADDTRKLIRRTIAEYERRIRPR
jgi:uncharacterized protein (UPF0332 family)